jgi:hypothetical protein
VALGGADAFEVVSYKNEFLTARGWLVKDALSERYISLFSEIAPDVHRGFLQEYLDVVLRRPGGAQNKTINDDSTRGVS